MVRSPGGPSAGRPTAGRAKGRCYDEVPLGRVAEYGRRARFRSVSGDPGWGFKSPLAHVFSSLAALSSRTRPHPDRDRRDRPFPRRRRGRDRQRGSRRRRGRRQGAARRRAPRHPPGPRGAHPAARTSDPRSTPPTRSSRSRSRGPCGRSRCCGTTRSRTSAAASVLRALLDERGRRRRHLDQRAAGDPRLRQPVTQGVSAHNLSLEEEEAIRRALDGQTAAVEAG